MVEDLCHDLVKVIACCLCVSCTNNFDHVYAWYILLGETCMLCHSWLDSLVTQVPLLQLKFGSFTFTRSLPFFYSTFWS